MGTRVVGRVQVLIWRGNRWIALNMTEFERVLRETDSVSAAIEAAMTSKAPATTGAAN